MSIAEYSSLAVASAVVVYVLALVAHAGEWAAARRVRPTVTEREPVLVASGGTAPGGPPTDPAAPGAAGLSPDQRLNLFGRLGVSLTVLAFALHTVGVLLRGVAADRAPWGNMYEFVLAALAMVVGTYLVLLWRRGMRYLGLPVTFLAALGTGLAITVLFVPVGPLVPALDSVWFIIHIVAAAIAAAAFNVGALLSVLYLLKSRAEGRAATPDAVGGYLGLLPSARTLDHVAYKCHAFGFPLWTFAVAAGAVWAEYAWGRYWGWDPKETWALVTWVIYAGYLHARATAGWRGGRAAGVALVGVASFWFNFVGVNLLFSGLHSYAGI